MNRELISDHLIVIALYFRAERTDLMNLNIMFDVCKWFYLRFNTEQGIRHIGKILETSELCG